MKIGSKIALFYTLLSVLTTIIIIAVFYLFSTQFINKLYASYLREKAYLTAQKHWEKDEIDEQDKNFDTNTNIVDVYVNYLRVKIDRDFDKKLIHTVVGLGYIMNA